MNSKFLVFGLLLLASFAFAIPITTCDPGGVPQMTVAGATYTVSNELDASGYTCLTVAADNITLDCQGNLITTNTGGTNGINNNEENGTTIENCLTGTVDIAMAISGDSENFTVQNNTFDCTNAPSSSCLYIEWDGTYYPLYGQIIGNTIIGGADNLNIGHGDYINALANNFTKNAGIIISDPNSNYNTFNNSTTGNIYYDGGGSGLWNTYPVYTSSPPNYADVPYGHIPYDSTTLGGLWVGNGADYKPWTALNSSDYIPPDCSYNVTTTNITLSRDINASGDCFDISAPDVTIDCNGYSITGDGTGTGIYSDQNGTTVKNCNLSGFGDAGIQLDFGSDGSLIDNTTSVSDNNGLQLVQSSNNQIYNSEFDSLYSSGFDMFYSSNSNVFENITSFSGGNAALAVIGYSTYPTHNTFNHLNLTGTGGTYALDMELGGNDGFNVFGNSTMTSDTGVTLYLSEASHNTFENMTLIGNSQTLTLDSSSNDNTISGSNILGNSDGYYPVGLFSSSNNTITLSNISSSLSSSELGVINLDVSAPENNITNNYIYAPSANGISLGFSDAGAFILNNTIVSGNYCFITAGDLDTYLGNNCTSDLWVNDSSGAGTTDEAPAFDTTFGTITLGVGYNITMIGSHILTNVAKGASTTATTAYVYDDNGDLLASSPFSGNNAAFGILLNDSQDYVILVDAGGSPFTSDLASTVSYPFSDTDTTWNSGFNLICEGGCNDYSEGFAISSLTFDSGGEGNTFSTDSPIEGNIWNLANGMPASSFCNIFGSPWATSGTDLPFSASTPCLNGTYWVGASADYHPYATPVHAVNLFVFYDVSGNLWTAYYQSGNFNITEVNGSSVGLPSDQPNGFGAVLRPSKFLTFDSDGAILYDYSGNTTSTTSFPNSIIDNSFYDPYTFAYTSQFSTLSTDGSSYYLIMADNTSDSELLKVSLDGSSISTVTTSAAPAAWQTIANDNALHAWYYAFPTDCGNDTSSIEIYSYDGSSYSPVATPDSTCYNNSDIANAKIKFEADNGYDYFIQFNTTNTFIYRLNDGMSYQLNYTMKSISPFLFYDSNNFVFYSQEGINTYVYSCYFGTSPSCFRNSLADYGTPAVQVQGNGVTTYHGSSSDRVTHGYTLSSSPVIPIFQTTTTDIKYVCNDEVSFTELPANYRILTNSSSLVMAPGTNVWEYAAPSSSLGPGQRRVYSFCTDGSNRQYFEDDTAFTNRSYSLNLSSGNYYNFNIVDCFNLGLNNVLVTSNRYIPTLDNWEVVEQAYSQVNGVATLFMEPNTLYTLTFSQPGLATNTQQISPTNTTTNYTVQMGCGGSLSPAPVYEAPFDDLEYWVNPPGPGPFVTDPSYTVNLTSYSPTGRIVSTNWVITMTPTGTANVANYSSVIVFNVTSTSRFGFNTSYTISGEQPALYSIVGTIINVRDNINNVNGTYNLTTSVFQQTTITQSSVEIKQLNALINGPINTLGKGVAFSGWAWLFVSTVMTMLVIGYISRFTLDGAGIVGAIVFTGLSLLNNAAVSVPGFGYISMILIATLSWLIVLAILAWRYV